MAKVMSNPKTGECFRVDAIEALGDFVKVTCHADGGSTLGFHKAYGVFVVRIPRDQAERWYVGRIFTVKFGG